MRKSSYYRSEESTYNRNSPGIYSTPRDLFKEALRQSACEALQQEVDYLRQIPARKENCVFIRGKAVIKTLDARSLEETDLLAVVERGCLSVRHVGAEELGQPELILKS